MMTRLPNLVTFGGSECSGIFHAVKLGLKNFPEGSSPRSCVSGHSAYYPDSTPDILVLLRKLEIRMNSLISYLYR